MCFDKKKWGAAGLQATWDISQRRYWELLVAAARVDRVVKGAEIWNMRHLQD